MGRSSLDRLNPARPPAAVSVVICSRDRLDYLKLALRSVYSQTFADYEIVLVDDASKDGTRAWIERRKPPRLRYIRLPRGLGPAGARNLALAETRGDYIAFLDSDDLWHPAYLETLLRGFGRPEVMICLSNFHRIDEEGRPLGHSGLRAGMPADSILPAIVGLPFLPRPSAAVVRREVFDAIGWFEEESLRSFCLDDTDLFVRIGLEFGPPAFHFLDIPLVAKRRHAVQITAGFPSLKSFLLSRDVRAGRLSARQADYLLDWAHFSRKYRHVVELIAPDSR